MSRIKGITIVIDGETKGLNKALQDVNKRSRDIQKELRQVDKLLKFNPGNTQLVAQKQKLLAEQVENTREKLNRLKSAQDDVNEAFKRGEISEEDYRAFQREIVETESKLKHFEGQLKQSQNKVKEFGDKMKQAGDKMKEVGRKMSDVGKDLSMKVTAPIVGLGTLATKSAIDFESAFAGVRKTVDATEEQFAALEKGIRDMSKELPSSASDIASVAEAAGQLGIKTENILGFTRVMIDLGEATNLSSEEAATALARFANIVGMSQEDFDKLGSSIVALGNNFATTEAEIVEMGMRLAGVGAQIGLTESEIMALATAMSSVGIEAEAGGTAMTMVLKKMQNAVSDGGKSLDGFAKAAGMSSKEFAKAFESEPIVALDAFIKGLAKSSEEGANLNDILSDLGIKGVRESDAILRLTGATDLLAEAVGLSSEAWEENTALSNEAAQRYATTASQLQMFKNAISDLAIEIGNILIPILMQVIEAVRPWIDRFKELDESTQKTILVIAGIAAAIGPLLVIIGTLVSSIGSIVGAIGTVISWFGGWTAVAGGLKAALLALTGPIGWVIAAIAALIAIGIAVYKNWDTIKEKAIQLKDVVVEKFIELKDKIVEFFTKTIPEAFKTFVKIVSQLPNQVKKFLVKLFTEYIPYYIGYGVAWMIKRISEGINQTVTYFRELPTRIKNFLTTAINNISTWAINTKNKAVEAGRNFLNSLVNFFKQLPSRINTFLLNVITRMIKFRNDMKQKAIETGKNVFNSIVNGIKNLPSRLMSLGSDIIRGLINGIKNRISSILGIAKDIATSFTNGFKNAMGIKSPSRVMIEMAKYIIQGLGNGIKNMSNYAVNQAKDVAEKITGAIENGIDLPTMELDMKYMGSRIKRANEQMNDVPTQKSIEPTVTDKGTVIHQHITIISPDPTSPSDNARKMKQAARQLAMEW